MGKRRRTLQKDRGVGHRPGLFFGRFSLEKGGYRVHGPSSAPQCHAAAIPPPPPCDIPSGCCSFTGPGTVTRSSLRMLRRVVAFCRPLRPVLLLVSFPRSQSPVAGVPGLCWMWHGVPFACQWRPIIGVLRMCWLLPPPPPPILLIQETASDRKLTEPTPTVAWPHNDDGRHSPASLLSQYIVMNTAPEAPPEIVQALSADTAPEACGAATIVQSLRSSALRPLGPVDILLIRLSPVTAACVAHSRAESRRAWAQTDPPDVTDTRTDP